MNEKMMHQLDAMKQYMQDVFGDDLLLSGGPGHIVFDDYNLGDDAIEVCIRDTDEFLADPSRWSQFSMFRHYDEAAQEEILKTTRQFLVDLLAIPEDERYVYEEEDFEIVEDIMDEPNTKDWFRIGRAVEVNIDRNTDDNLIVFYLVYGEKVEQVDGETVVEVRALVPLHLYENVTRTSLERLAGFMERSDSEMMEGQAQQIREYLMESQSRLN